MVRLATQNAQAFIGELRGGSASGGAESEARSGDGVRIVTCAAAATPSASEFLGANSVSRHFSSTSVIHPCFVIRL